MDLGQLNGTLPVIGRKTFIALAVEQTGQDKLYRFRVIDNQHLGPGIGFQPFATR